MRTITLLALFAILICLSHQQTRDYTYWQRWNNVPTPFIQNKITDLTADPNMTSNLTNWIRNRPGNTHFSGKFNDFSFLRNQNLYWRKSNPNQILFCRTKYYLFSDTINRGGFFVGLCKKNPYYWSPQAPQFCVPNTYNIPYGPGACSNAYIYLNGQDCCYRNNYDPILVKFESDFTARDLVFNAVLM